jgi:ATP-binding cassette subfamily B protein
MHHGGWRALIDDNPDDRKGKIDRELIARVFTYARPHAASIGIVLVAIIIVSLLGLIPPLLYRSLIDNVLPNGNVRQLNMLALAMLGIPVISGLVSVVQRHYSAKAGEGIIYDLRLAMYEHLQHMSLRFFTATKSGEIISRFNNDVVGAQNAVTGTVPDITTNLVTLVSTLAIMISIEWRLTVLAVLVLPLFLLPARRVARMLRDIRRKGMEYNADMSSIVGETLSVNGALLVKTFGTQRRERQRFGAIDANVRDIGIRRAQVSQVFFLGLSLAATIGTALIYWAGGYMVIGGAITVGTIVAFAAYLSRLYGPITSLTNMQVEFAQAMVSFERVFEYLDMPIEIADRPGAVPLKDVDGRVEFDGVWFQYLDLLGPSNQSTLIEVGPEPTGALEEGEDEDADEEVSVAQVHVPTRLWAIEDVSFQIEQARRRSRTCCRASTIHRRGLSSWTAWTCATQHRNLSPTRSAWSRRRPIFSTTPYAPTCCIHVRTRRRKNWKRLAARPTSMT